MAFAGLVVMLMLAGPAVAGEALDCAASSETLSRADQLWFAEAALEEINELTQRVSQAIDAETRSRRAQSMRRQHEEMLASLNDASVAARALDNHSAEPERAGEAYRTLCEALDQARRLYAKANIAADTPPRLAYPLQTPLEVPSGEPDLWFEADTFSEDVWSASWWEDIEK